MFSSDRLSGWRCRLANPGFRCQYSKNHFTLLESADTIFWNTASFKPEPCTIDQNYIPVLVLSTSCIMCEVRLCSQQKPAELIVTHPQRLKFDHFFMLIIFFLKMPLKVTHALHLTLYQCTWHPLWFSPNLYILFVYDSKHKNTKTFSILIFSIS